MLSRQTIDNALSRAGLALRNASDILKTLAYLLDPEGHPEPAEGSGSTYAWDHANQLGDCCGHPRISHVRGQCSQENCECNLWKEPLPLEDDEIPGYPGSIVPPVIVPPEAEQMIHKANLSKPPRESSPPLTGSIEARSKVDTFDPNTDTWSEQYSRRKKSLS